MKTFIFSIGVDSWLKVSVEANNLEIAKDKLFDMSLEELIENGYVKQFDIIGDIDYDIETDEDLKELEGLIDEVKTDRVEVEESKGEDLKKAKNWLKCSELELYGFLERKAKELGIICKSTKELVEELFKELDWEDEEDLKEELLSLLQK